jgi:enterochelin esterase-like enzyme
MAKTMLTTVLAAAILIAPGAAEAAASETSAPPTAGAPFRVNEAGEVVIGVARQFESEILGGTVTYIEHLPADYATSGRNYPLVLQLDAQDPAVFAIASGTLDRLGVERIPPMILIGLSTTGVAADLSPCPPAKGRPSAADVVLDFMDKEFLPHLVRTYRIDDFRILSGQSAAGLFSLYAFLARPDLFQAFVASSPTIACPDLIRDRARATGLAGPRPHTLFVFHGQFDDPALVGNQMPGLKALLETPSRNGLRGYVRFVERAGCVPVTCLNDALLELFHDFVVSPEIANRGVEAIDAHYRGLSERYGFAIRAPEGVYLRLGAKRAREGRLDEAAAAFEALVARYPDSPRGRAFLGKIRKQP